MRKLLITLVATACLIHLVTGAAAAATLYGAASVQPATPASPLEGQSSLYTINLSTGAATRVGSIGFNLDRRKGDRA